MRLEGHGADETIGVHEVQPGNAVQPRTFGSALIGMGSEFEAGYTFDDEGRSETRSVVLDCAFLIMKLFQIGVLRHAKKVV